jgi:hypothetical protein
MPVSGVGAVAACAGLPLTVLPAIADADPIFSAIDAHRKAYAEMEKAGDDYDASPEDEEEGPIGVVRANLLRRRGWQATGSEGALGRWPGNAVRQSKRVFCDAQRRVGPRIRSVAECEFEAKPVRAIRRVFYDQVDESETGRLCKVSNYVHNAGFEYPSLLTIAAPPRVMNIAFPSRNNSGARFPFWG